MVLSAFGCRPGHHPSTPGRSATRLRTQDDVMTAPPITIDEQDLVATLVDLVSFASIGGSTDEHRIQEHLADIWDREGLAVDRWQVDLRTLASEPGFPGMEVERGGCTGVTATWTGVGGGPTLLIDGHTDVVPPGDIAAWSADPFKARVVAGEHGPIVAGRGTCDMKGGLASAMAAVRALRAQGVRLRGDVVLAPVSGEEDGGVGTFALLRELDRRGVTPSACVIPEPTNLDIVPANGGALTFRLRVPGRAAHASRRTEGVNAVTALQPVLAALSDLETRRNTPVDPLMQRWPIAYPISVGVVRSGDWASTVPDLLIAEGRYGVALGEPSSAAREAFEAAIAEACAGDPWLRDHPVEVQWWGGQFESGHTRVDAPLVEVVRTAHHQHMNRLPEVYGAPYGSDLRLLAPRMATVQYGPGDSALAHSPAESVPVAQLIECARTLALTMIAVCGAATD